MLQRRLGRGRNEDACPVGNLSELAVERQLENADRQLIGRGTTQLASLS
jgi:hypothetical protein